jgi:inosose dehydratase
VCEVPGWGVQLPPDRVLRELRGLGLRATELGPPGFLPEDAEKRREVLLRHGLQVAAGFVPAVLHDPARRAQEVAGVEAAAAALRAAGAQVLVLAAVTGQAGYERAGRLSDEGWASLGEGVAACAQVTARAGLTLAVHPHYGTVVETQQQVQRLLEVTTAGICLDVGHLTVGGSDPLEVARLAGSRVRHVHLKDVDPGLAARVRAGAVGYQEAVKAGLYTPLGQGASRIAEIVRHLEATGYTGWYVLEHDVVLETMPPLEDGPVKNAARSLEFLRKVAA